LRILTRITAKSRRSPLVLKYRSLASKHDPDKETESERDAERRYGVVPDGGLNGVNSLTGRILRAFELMVPGALDLPGEGIEVLAQRGKALGNLFNILAQRLVAWHFGVFPSHFVLPCLFDEGIGRSITTTVKPPFRVGEL
jgi:hypothetical protein